MMKIIMILILIAVSFSAYSEKMTIRGKPVELKVHEGFFSFPHDYTDKKKGYHFVKFAGMRRVCFIEERPEFASLDLVQIIIEDEGKKIRWNCYHYDPRYFKVEF